jgi:hypothetical protein
MAGKKKSKGKDLSPKTGGAVKGGRLAANDNVSFVRVR